MVTGEQCPCLRSQWMNMARKVPLRMDSFPLAAGVPTGSAFRWPYFIPSRSMS